MEHGLSMHEALGYIRSVLPCHPSHRQLEVGPKSSVWTRVKAMIAAMLTGIRASTKVYNPWVLVS